MITRPVTEADIQFADFQNFSQQSAPVRQALNSVSRGSDAYNRAMWALKGASTPTPLRQVGTDGQVHNFERQPTQGQVLQQAFPQFTPTMQQTALRALGASPEQVQAEVAPRTMQRQPRASAGGEIWNPGSVNGKAVMAPTPGNYPAMMALRRRAGLTAMDDTGINSYNQAQNQLALAGYENPDQNYEQQAAAGMVQSQKAAAAAHLKRQQELNDSQREHNRALELETVKAGGKADQIRKQGLEFHQTQMEKWKADQVKARQLAGLVGNLPDVDPETGLPKMLTDAQGNQVPVAALRAQAQALNYPQPTYAQSLLELGTPEAMAELTRLGKNGGAAPAKPPERNWLQKGADMVGGVVKRATDPDLRKIAGREQQAKAFFQRVASTDPDPKRRAEAKAYLAKLK